MSVIRTRYLSTFCYKVVAVSCIRGPADTAAGIKTTVVYVFLTTEEKTKDYGRLVHKLLSQYTEGGRAWVEKYPTSRHLPMVGVAVIR